MFERLPGRLLLAFFIGFGIAPQLQAAPVPLPFSASFDTVTDIVGVVDPAGPVVQVQSQGSGSGAFGVLDYRSADQVNLATGQGEGDNVFTAADGSALFGHFTVQLLPTGNPLLLSLVGLVDIVGGSGRFDGADGELRFSADGAFVSPSQALLHFVFDGQLQVVDEPAGLPLVLAALLLGAAARRRRVPSPSAARARASSAPMGGSGI